MALPGLDAFRIPTKQRPNPVEPNIRLVVQIAQRFLPQLDLFPEHSFFAHLLAQNLLPCCFFARPLILQYPLQFVSEGFEGTLHGLVDKSVTAAVHYVLCVLVDDFELPFRTPRMITRAASDFCLVFDCEW